MVTPRTPAAQAPSPATGADDAAEPGGDPGAGTGGPAGLTIGDLSERTGVATATLRMWESRHGFPRPQRLESGHRRYAETDVGLVRQVLRGRDAGARLEVAIAGVVLANA